MFETALAGLLAIVGGRSGGNRTRWKTSGRLEDLFGDALRVSRIDTLKRGWVAAFRAHSSESGRRRSVGKRTRGGRKSND
jgi:hypothetical protein